MILTHLEPEQKSSAPSAPTERENFHAISKQESYACAQDGVRLDSRELKTPTQVRGQKNEARLRRWKRRAESKKMLKGFTRPGGRLYSVAKCDWTLGNLVTVTFDGTKAGYAGIEHCHSISACPCCSASIRQQRAYEIEKAVTAHQKGGGEVLFATLTVPHHAGDSLKDLVRTVRESWRNIARNKWWRTNKKAYISALEITYGANGWHPHLHVLIFFDEQLSQDAFETYGNELHHYWARAVENRSGKKPLRQAQDLQKCDKNGKVLAKYLGKVQEKKWSVGAEMSRFDLKTGRDSINPFDLLDTDLETNLDLTDTKRIALWREYVEATYGTRVITWSRGLKTRYNIDELTDEEAQNKAEAIDKQVAVYAIPAKLYRSTPPEDKCALLQAVEGNNLAFAKSILPDYHTVPRRQWE